VPAEGPNWVRSIGRSTAASTFTVVRPGLQWAASDKYIRDRVFRAYKSNLCAIAYIYFLYAVAYLFIMDMIARTPQQLGAGIRRNRRQKKLTQSELGEKMHARQATVSKLEAGRPATQLRILMDALAALDLELVIRPRTKISAEEIENLF
jgi:HTH-type transcriptional regulator / antitoxin HipB